MNVFRNIVAEEWQRAVQEFDLRPGSVTETVVSRIASRISDELPREAEAAVNAVLALARRKKP